MSVNLVVYLGCRLKTSAMGVEPVGIVIPSELGLVPTIVLGCLSHKCNMLV